MPHEGPMRARSQCPQDLPSVRSSFLPPVRLFIQFPNLDPNPSAHLDWWAAAPVRGTTTAVGEEARRSGGGRWAGNYVCARREALAATAGRLGLVATTRAAATVRWAGAVGYNLLAMVL